MPAIAFEKTETDLANCENEPIRYSGTVQPHGALLVCQLESGTIEAASESCAAILGVSPESLLGITIGSAFGAVVEAALMASVIEGQKPLVPLTINNKKYLARACCNETGELLVDIETDSSDMSVLQEMLYQGRRGLDALRLLNDVAEITRGAAELVKSMTGFDQVMIYRFDPTWNGEVIAEARNEGVEPYLGLTFPASDIPQQARELFKLCKVRLIPDVLYCPSVLICNGDRWIIDLGRSALRSVSPIHIEYLTNMGARATLVGALIVDGQLWGLVSCQQKNNPLHIGPAERDVLGWLIEDVALLIESRLTRQRLDRVGELTQRRRTLIAAVRLHNVHELMHSENNADLLSVVGAEGFALVVDHRIQTTGKVPSTARIRELLQQRAAIKESSAIFATNSLCTDLCVEEIDDGIAGALFVSVQRKTAASMIWFRSERSRSVHWGGDPAHPHFADQTGRMSPRKSFELFLQTVRGQSIAWLPEEMTSATELASLIDIEALRREEAFSNTILSSIPEHIAVIDANGLIVAVNDPWKQFAAANNALGLAEVSPGISYREFCAAGGEEAKVAWEGIEAVLDRRQESFVLDYPCDSPDAKRWFRMRVSRLIPPAEGVLVAHENITQTKMLEIQLHESNQHLELVLAGSDLGTWDWDIPNGNVLFDERWCAMLGYRPDEIEPTIASWELLVHPDDWPITQKLQSGILHKEENLPYASEYRLRHKDGHWVWVLDRGKVVERDRQGKPLRAAGTRLDISDRKQLKLEGTELLRRMESLIMGLDERSSTEGQMSQEAAKVERVTARQREVLTLVAAGLTSAAIAERLKISHSTVITHRRDLMRKLGLHSTAEMTRYAIQNKLIST
ncbi:MAG: PAS domain-containing protein [Azonexus sp.]|nr:PAS domain-containing protein [Azonexus sp.]